MHVLNLIHAQSECSDFGLSKTCEKLDKFVTPAFYTLMHISGLIVAFTNCKLKLLQQWATLALCCCKHQHRSILSIML